MKQNSSSGFVILWSKNLTFKPGLFIHSLAIAIFRMRIRCEERSHVFADGRRRQAEGVEGILAVLGIICSDARGRSTFYELATKGNNIMQKLYPRPLVAPPASTVAPFAPIYSGYFFNVITATRLITLRLSVRIPETPSVCPTIPSFGPLFASLGNAKAKTTAAALLLFAPMKIYSKSIFGDIASLPLRLLAARYKYTYRI